MIRTLIRPLFLASFGLASVGCAGFEPGAPAAMSVAAQEGSPAFAYRQVSEHLAAVRKDYRIIRLVAGKKGSTELSPGNTNWRVWLHSAQENKTYIANAAPGEPVTLELAPAELKAGSEAIEVSRWRVDAMAAQAAARKAGLEAVHGLALHSAQDLKIAEGREAADPVWVVRQNSLFVYISAHSGELI